MMRTIFALVTTVSCIKVLISASQKTGRPKNLNHSLKLSKSNNMKNSNIFWDLDYNEKKFRIRAGRYYLDMSTKKYLIALDGGEEMEIYNENEKIREIKDLISREDSIDRERARDESVDSLRKSGSGQETAGTNKSTNSRKTRIFNDPIVPREKSNLISPGDSTSKEYLSQLAENIKSSLYDAESTPDSMKSQYRSDLRDDEEKTVPKDLQTDSKPKIELVEASKKTSALSGPNTKSNATPQYRDGSAKGYVFSLIPVFKHKMDKRMLIAKDGWCLTHKMVFKVCEYSRFWSLDDSFYWDIFKAEDVSYIDRLMKSLMNKAERNKDIKKASYINSNTCPSSCPDGDCDTDESDDEDSDDHKAPYNTQYSNRQIVFNPQPQQFNQRPGRGMAGYYPATQPIQYGMVQPVDSSTYSTHSPFSNESVIIDRGLFEKLKQAYDRTSVRN